MLDLSINDVTVLHWRQWKNKQEKFNYTDNQYIFPYGSEYDDCKFMICDVNIDICDCVNVNDRLVNKYVKMIAEHDYLGMYYGKVENGKLCILQGNHCISAKKRIGIKKVNVLIPQDDFNKIEII